MGREMAAALQRWPALIDHPVRPQLTAVCDINPAALGWFDQIPTVTPYGDRLRRAAGRRHDRRGLRRRPARPARAALRRHHRGGQESAGREAVRHRRGAPPEPILAAAAEHPESFVRCSSEMPFFPGAQLAIDYVRSGALGRVIEARCAFLHASDLDVDKPINWKRQARYCGEAGVMNDLGPARLARAAATRLASGPRLRGAAGHRDRAARPPTAAGSVCDTWDNATVHGWVPHDDYEFPLTHRDEADRPRPEEHLGVRGHRAGRRRALLHQEPEAGRAVLGGRTCRAERASRPGRQWTSAASRCGRR